MKPSVAEWLQEKDILITGATGFIGKVLVEKLLRCCNVNRLFLIVRTKRGAEPNDRLKDLTECALFGPLLEKKPNAFDKVTIIPGDMSKLDCGISEEHQAILKENVSVVFHAAASVRFDEPFTTALKLNTRGTHELIKIAKQMPKLEVFQHVSTTYCNANVNGTIEEKVYPSHHDWKILIDLLESDSDTLDILAPRLIGTHPNTYTLSKALAENVVLEASKKLPAVIARPSIITPVLFEPVPGWLDNLNGAMGIIAGAAKAVLRTARMDGSLALDFLPADISINGIIAAAWFRRFHSHNNGELEVFNQAYSESVPITAHYSVDAGRRLLRERPMENYIWYPFIIFTNNAYLFQFLFFFLQLIPALLQDLLLIIAGKEKMLLKLNIKIFNRTTVGSRFTERKFTFANKKCMALNEYMNEEDQKIYDVHPNGAGMDPDEIVAVGHLGLKKFIFKEKDEDLPLYRKWHRRLYYIDRATRIILISTSAWLLTSKVTSVLSSWLTTE